MKKNMKDAIYSQQGEGPDSFTFNGQVAAVFEDMIERSVPGYNLTLEMIGVIARHLGQDQSNCYDLGCSLGASTLALRHNLNASECRIIAIDNSSAMIDKCRRNLAEKSGEVPVDVLLQDVQDTQFENASISVMNFTLQFIPPNERLDLLTRIAQSTRSGGVLVLSEKTAFANRKEEGLLADLHHEFKRYKGYSDLEISRKRSALEDVLIPETIEQHKNRLNAAGFSGVHIWFQCFNFVSMIGVR